MKKIFFTLLISVSIFAGSTLGYTSEKNVPAIKAGSYDAGGEIITVKAKGLVCEFCAKALEKVFLKKEAVSGLSVDLTTKEILINLKEGKTMDEETIRKLIQDAGYNIQEIVRPGSDLKDEAHH